MCLCIFYQPLTDSFISPCVSGTPIGDILWIRIGTEVVPIWSQAQPHECRVALSREEVYGEATLRIPDRDAQDLAGECTNMECHGAGSAGYRGK